VETAGQRSSMSAMQLALEALEQIHPGNLTPMAEEAWNKAITALRQALETEQEPVAWITNGGKGELWWYQSSKFDEEGNLIGPNPDDIPLYTAPPKKPWVGLTLNEAEEFYDKYTDRAELINAIDSFLEEKNT
jgi:hypothetical protein